MVDHGVSLVGFMNFPGQGSFSSGLGGSNNRLVELSAWVRPWLGRLGLRSPDGAPGLAADGDCAYYTHEARRFGRWVLLSLTLL